MELNAFVVSSLNLKVLTVKRPLARFVNKALKKEVNLNLVQQRKKVNHVNLTSKYLGNGNATVTVLK